MTAPTQASVSVRPLRPTWIEVSRSALINNVRQLRRIAHVGSKLMAVVKANAYGHGLVATTEALVEAGVDCVAVATLSEAVELRQANLQLPLLILGYTPPALVADALRYGVTLTVYDYPTALAYAAAAANAGQVLTVHVKVNTGMNRLGVDPAEAVALVSGMATLSALRVEGIFTHFATSDELDKRFAEEQFARFSAVLAALDAAALRPPLAHAANSAALLTMPQTHLDMVRSGIALYGLHPDAEQTRLPAGFQAALTWKAEVAHLLCLKPGDTVSYGREFAVTRPMVAAVVPVGYADGFPRRPLHWGHVLIGGRPAPILGRVCMDQSIVDITATVEAGLPVRQGDEVVIIGRQGDAQISAEDAAERVGTNNYDIVSRILARVPRVMVK